MKHPSGGSTMVRAVSRFLLVLVIVALATPAPAQTPKRGGVLRNAGREGPGLDPHLSRSFLAHSYVSLSYSQLVRFPHGPEQKSPTDFSILPDLAEKWTVSKDGKVYTFTLRKAVRFHQKPPVNGREVVADDVKYSLERFMAKSGFATRFEPVSSIDVIDRHTVRVTLKEPYAPFLNHLANSSFCAILPRDAEEKFKDFNHPDAVRFGEGCVDAGPVPCALKEWKLDTAKLEPARAKYLVGYDPAEARRLLAEAGFPRGFTTPMFHWPGYVVPWRSYYELAAENLGKVGINVELKAEEYGKYISTTAVGKFEKMAMGPSTPFTEVDDFLFGRFYPELPTNQSHVADAELRRMLLAQRREMDPKKRKQIVDDIQRYLADKAYYIYVPQWPQYVSHPPYVKGFQHHDGYGLRMRLPYTWLDQ